MTLHEAKQKLQDLYDEYRYKKKDGESWGVGMAIAIINSVDDYSKQCLECGKWFTPTDPYKQKYCSMECKKNHKKKLEEKK